VQQKQKQSHDAVDPIPLLTTGTMFANGTAIEPLRHSPSTDRLSLLYWDGLQATIGSKLICDGQSYVPAPIDPSILRALTLPSGIAPYGSAHKLLADMSKVVGEYAGLSDNSAAAMSRWALSSWFPEMRPSPGLSLIGQDTTAGKQLFQLLHCFCRHPLLLTEVNAAGLRALPWAWQLTPLIHQPELTVEMQRMLSTARRIMGFIPRGGRLLDLHCAVGTYTQLANTYGSGVIPSMEFSMIPSRQGVSALDNAVRQEISTDFQPRLLRYRLENFSKVLNSSFTTPELTSSMQELARNLGACTPDDPQLQAQVIEFLLETDKEIRSSAWLNLEFVILEALLAFIHAAKENAVYVAEITKAVQVILGARGEDRKLEPRAIGARLRALGLITEPRDRNGIRLLLSRELSRRVHELVRSFSVPLNQDCLKSCDLCNSITGSKTRRQKSAGPRQASGRD
jgi:hypothetical protein